MLRAAWSMEDTSEYMPTVQNLCMLTKIIIYNVAIDV